MTAKRQNGQFYTVVNPFRHEAFRTWAADANMSRACVLEPFAGANSLIAHLEALGACRRSISYDIEPSHPEVQRRDTLESFPTGFDICVTNPPWLARNSATARGLDFPECEYDDLYKFATEKCLDNCGWVAVLVPESFIRANIFRERLSDFVSITSKLFADTHQPVGLALFRPDPVSETTVWSRGDRVGALSDLERMRPVPAANPPGVRFNDPNGDVGLIAFDNTRTASIRFCEASEVDGYEIKHSSRFITKIRFEGQVRIDAWNSYLRNFRSRTRDVLMTCYRGLREDGMYRRRLDWRLAREIMQQE